MMTFGGKFLSDTKLHRCAFGGALLLSGLIGCGSKEVVRSSSDFLVRVASTSERKEVREEMAVEGIGLTLHDAMMDAERRAKELSASALVILEVMPTTTQVLAKSGMLPLRVPTSCRYAGTCLGTPFQSVPQPQTMGVAPFRAEPVLAEETNIVIVRGVVRQHAEKPSEGSR